MLRDGQMTRTKVRQKDSGFSPLTMDSSRLLLIGLLVVVCAVIPIHSGGYGYGNGGHGGHGGGGHGGGYGYLKNILNHPLIQCRIKGGTCMNIDNCNTTRNIYKDICKDYHYNDVCCISRETICNKFAGFCTNSSDVCLQAGQLLNKFNRNAYGLSLGDHHGKGEYIKKGTVLSWLACNSTHRCCHSVKTSHKRYHSIHDQGGYQHGHGGHGHGGGHHGGGHHSGGYGGSYYKKK